ncbi:MAG: N-acetylmuramoyl-L-alanine amidase [Candidatus Alcyoniella australis]|nr:N-acetylmuramoyl-L-alanine amidase [Candidatus Alcyoniella australis]
MLQEGRPLQGLPLWALALLLLLPLLLGAAQVSVGGHSALIPAWTIEGEQYYDLSALCRALEVKLTSHPETQRSSLARGTSRLVLAPGSPQLLLDGRVIQLPSPPRWVQGAVAVPAAFLGPLSELLGSPVIIESFTSDDRPGAELIRAALEPAAISRVVLDPGHGGSDPGALGPEGHCEKDVTLAVALMAKPIIERELGCEVLMTRTSDVFVPLAERTRLANAWGADLFVSIHANGYRRSEASGVETFYLAMTASDEQAAAVAAEENAVLQLEGGPSPDALSDLQAILWDMVQTEVLQASAEVAELIQSRLADFAETANRGVKQAPFFVLIGTQMPAVLVEVGFITNPDEARRLSRPEVQLELARAIAMAIVDYDARLRNGM